VPAMEAGVSAEQLLRLPVRVRGIDVGHAVDLLVDNDAQRVLGLDVLCRDGEHRFLPLTAAIVRPDEIAVDSALTLLTENELGFYRKRATTLRGKARDVLVAPDGTIVPAA